MHPSAEWTHTRCRLQCFGIGSHKARREIASLHDHGEGTHRWREAQGVARGRVQGGIKGTLAAVLPTARIVRSIYAPTACRFSAQIIAVVVVQGGVNRFVVPRSVAANTGRPTPPMAEKARARQNLGPGALGQDFALRAVQSSISAFCPSAKPRRAPARLRLLEQVCTTSRFG